MGLRHAAVIVDFGSGEKGIGEGGRVEGERGEGEKLDCHFLRGWDRGLCGRWKLGHTGLVDY